MTIEVNLQDIPAEVMEALTFGVRMDHAYSKNLKKNYNGRKKNKDVSQCTVVNSSEEQAAEIKTVVVKPETIPIQPARDLKRKKPESEKNKTKTPSSDKTKKRKTIIKKENLNNSNKTVAVKGAKPISVKKKNLLPNIDAEIRMMKGGPNLKTKTNKKSSSRTTASQAGKNEDVESTTSIKSNNPKQKLTPKKAQSAVAKHRSKKSPLQAKYRKPITESLQKSKVAAAEKKKKAPSYTNKGVPSGNILVGNIIQSRTRRKIHPKK